MTAEGENLAALFDAVRKNALLYVESRKKLHTFFTSVEQTFIDCGVAIAMNVAIRIEDAGVYWALAWRRTNAKGDAPQWGLFAERWQANADGEDAMKERMSILSAPREVRIYAAMRFDKFLEVMNAKLAKELADVSAAVATIEGFLAEFEGAASTTA